MMEIEFTAAEYEKLLTTLPQKSYITIDHPAAQGYPHVTFGPEVEYIRGSSAIIENLELPEEFR